MIVNLGCGDRYAPGWINVDFAGSPHKKDLELDLRGELPWGDGELQLIYAGHLLEHLRVHEVTSLLRRLRPCLKSGGEMMIIGPDVDMARGMAVAGTLDVTLESLQYGADRWEGDVHRWECSAPAIRELLALTNWVNVTELSINDVPSLWPVADRRPQWQCVLHVVKE